MGQGFFQSFQNIFHLVGVGPVGDGPQNVAAFIQKQVNGQVDGVNGFGQFALGGVADNQHRATQVLGNHRVDVKLKGHTFAHKI